MSSSALSFDRSWTLFLDRDGVINRRIPGGYVRDFSEFVFLDGVLEALKIFSGIFGRIIVVSNQQGVGKGIMTGEAVEAIHDRMLKEVHDAGGRIDKIYYCPNLEQDHHADRKPGIGMALKAKDDFPLVDFSRSVMAGDSPTDIEFGKNAGMLTVWLGDRPDGPGPSIQADFCFNDLIALARAIQNH